MKLSINHTEKRFVNTLGATLLTYIICAGQVADIITTMIFASATDETGAAAFPHLVEGNMLFHDAVHSGQWFDFIAIKTLFTIAASYSILWAARRKDLGYRIIAVASGLVAAYTTWEIVFHNLRYMGVI